MTYIRRDSNSNIVEQALQTVTLEMPSTGRGLSNNRIDEDMKSTLRFQVPSSD